jgi:hypothetical protein
MVTRRLVFVTSIVATAISSFTLGVIYTHRSDASAQDASYDVQIASLRAEMRTQLGRTQKADVVTTSGTLDKAVAGKDEAGAPSMSARAKMVAEIKQELQTVWGLLPVNLLRDRRTSFVELYSSDNFGKTNYGTAGYLGNGYFITVKHAVVALKEDDDRQGKRKITSVKIVYRGKEIPAKVIDTGDADVEVHNGDWAISRRCTSTRRSVTTSPSRSSGWGTTTPRASSSRPATSASGPPTGSSPA